MGHTFNAKILFFVFCATAISHTMEVEKTFLLWQELQPEIKRIIIDFVDRDNKDDRTLTALALVNKGMFSTVFDVRRTKDRQQTLLDYYQNNIQPEYEDFLQYGLHFDFQLRYIFNKRFNKLLIDTYDPKTKDDKIPMNKRILCVETHPKDKSVLSYTCLAIPIKKFYQDIAPYFNNRGHPCFLLLPKDSRTQLLQEYNLCSRPLINKEILIDLEDGTPPIPLINPRSRYILYIVAAAQSAKSCVIEDTKVCKISGIHIDEKPISPTTQSFIRIILKCNMSLYASEKSFSAYLDTLLKHIYSLDANDCLQFAEFSDTVGETYLGSLARQEHNFKKNIMLSLFKQLGNYKKNIEQSSFLQKWKDRFYAFFVGFINLFLTLRNILSSPPVL